MTQTETIRIPAYLLENSAKVYRTIAELDKEMGRKPIPEEVAKRAGVSVNAVRRILERTFYTAHLHSVLVDGEEVTLFDVIADEGSPVPDSMISKTELPEKMEEALSLLKPRDEEIIRMRFGMNQENVVHTLGDIGKKFGLTRERIRQIQNQALKKISSSELGKVLRSFRE
jgi:RNA polymerase primary sigma factor